MTMLVVFYWVLLLLVAIGAFVSPSTWQYAPRANQLVILILFVIIGLKILKTDLVKPMGTILVIILILLLLGVFPRWGYSSNWGYGPSGVLGIILVIVIIPLLLGKL